VDEPVPTLFQLLKLDDSALISWRGKTRERLETDPDPSLQLLYDATTREITERAAIAWGLVPSRASHGRR
jgi:hypothetical protein